jgi:hypothetical protein
VWDEMRADSLPRGRVRVKGVNIDVILRCDPP